MKRGGEASLKGRKMVTYFMIAEEEYWQFSFFTCFLIVHKWGPASVPAASDCINIVTNTHNRKTSCLNSDHQLKSHPCIHEAWILVLVVLFSVVFTTPHLNFALLMPIPPFLLLCLLKTTLNWDYHLTVSPSTPYPLQRSYKAVTLRQFLE